MKILFAAVGKPSAPWAKSAIEHYRRFLSKYADCEWHWVKPASAGLTHPDAIRRVEKDRLLAVLGKHGGFRVVCDQSGRLLDTHKFARSWQKGTDAHGGRAIVMIGGPWGLDPEVLESADLVWSLSPLTLPHELALVTAAEQIARALAILRGDPYHK